MAIIAISIAAFVFAQISQSPSSGSKIVEISEQMPDGRVDVTVVQFEDLRLTIEVKLTSPTNIIDLSQLQPVAILAMEAMHMDGISPTLAPMREGGWIGSATLPMSGTWVMSIGFGEEFVEAVVEVR